MKPLNTKFTNLEGKIKFLMCENFMMTFALCQYVYHYYYFSKDYFFGNILNFLSKFNLIFFILARLNSSVPSVDSQIAVKMTIVLSKDSDFTNQPVMLASCK